MMVLVKKPLYYVKSPVMNDYKWTWWLIISILIAIIFCGITSLFPQNMTPLQESILCLMWSIWVLNFVACLYWGVKPESDKIHIH